MGANVLIAGGLVVDETVLLHVACVGPFASAHVSDAAHAGADRITDAAKEAACVGAESAKGAFRPDLDEIEFRI